MAMQAGDPANQVHIHSIRTFPTGATRNVDENKGDPEGFLSPLFIEGYSAYMQAHRQQADGSVRASDNWQKGIPLDAYRKSLMRHAFTAWALWRGWEVKPEQVGAELVVPTLLDALYALAFNVMGMVHELKKAEAVRQSLAYQAEQQNMQQDAADTQYLVLREQLRKSKPQQVLTEWPTIPSYIPVQLPRRNGGGIFGDFNTANRSNTVKGCE